jgi:hypothetical protein
VLSIFRIALDFSGKSTSCGVNVLLTHPFIAMDKSCQKYFRIHFGGL